MWIRARTREKAIANLLKDAAHMPYGTWENFEKRGYIIEEWEENAYIIRPCRKKKNPK